MGKLNPFATPKMPASPKPVALPPYVPPPAPEPVVPIPDVNDEAVRRKKKKAMMEQQQRSGRDSTFLTDDEDGLG